MRERWGMANLPFAITLVTEEITVTPVVHIKRPFWSKYGGVRRRPVANQWGMATPTEDWYCQSCANKQPKEFSPYLYEWPEQEFVRVCAICLNNECTKLLARL